MIAVQILVFLIAAFFITRTKWFSIRDFSGNWDRTMLMKLLKYSAMGLTSAIVAPLSLLIIRNFITKEISPEGAGYWEGINRLSSVYLTIFTTSLSVYFLPRLSETDDKIIIRRELLAGFRLLIPVVIFCSGIIFLCRFLIIRILFSGDFIPMEPLFLFQLIGDVIKIAAWLMAYIMLAKAMAKMFIITEIVFSASYIVLSFWLVQQYGLKGVTYAYALNYTLYLVTCFLLLRHQFSNRD